MFMGLKTAKETQLAAMEFIRAFENQTLEQFEGEFFPTTPLVIHQYKQRYLWISMVFGFLAGFLTLQAFSTDAIHYWHVDPYVIIGVSVLVGFWILFGWCLQQYWRYNQFFSRALSEPEQLPFGIFITEEYFFEHQPFGQHIIPRANIVRIDYEEVRNNGEHYLELLLEWDNHYEHRGLLYHPEEYDLHRWVTQKTSPAA